MGSSAGDGEPYRIRDSYYLLALWRLTAVAKPVEDGAGGYRHVKSRRMALGTVRCLVYRGGVIAVRYVKGDATSPQVKGPKIVAHVCNDAGGWGKGFVLAISKRWPEPERDFRVWHRHRASNDFGLGAIRLI